ncbi:hypothetical protein GPECTOR_18g78 [Gonium pectorale]|uniref:Uncharacterized protein n=1 Tax=Gonium pectorale TaxID=33097 RepID=A0A150GJV8_GONPE|nr:hypothetical protein GPECTOR_18g78 [Gonium pectorale]|eukprot:KXZ50102.1 hypothetical protein GPECTOR_18g78 [Gonium pectorale]
MRGHTPGSQQQVSSILAQMQAPVSAAMVSVLLFTVALAAFAAGAWSGQRSVECYSGPQRPPASGGAGDYELLHFPASGATASGNAREYRPQQAAQQRRQQAQAHPQALDRPRQAIELRSPAAEPGPADEGGRLSEPFAGEDPDAAALVALLASDIGEPTQYQPAFPENRPKGNGTTALEAVSTLRKEVAFLRRMALALRQAYGAAHCAQHGIGPSGGFCVTGPQAKDTVSGTLMDAPMCGALAKMLAGDRVADFGAGRGQYGKCLRNAVQSYDAYDGGEGVETATGGAVHFLDLSVPTYLGRTFDWVMSLEVGEHVPRAHESIYINNLLRHASRGLVLSWAIPGQGGHHHVNERPNDYILGRVEELGRGSWVYNASASATLRGASSFSWFKNTIMVFDRVRL